MVNPYKVLGVSPNADKSIVRAAYLELVKKYHPDSPDGDADKFHEIKSAWDAINKGTFKPIIKKGVWRHKSFFKVYKEE